LIAPKRNKRGKKVKKPARNYYQVNRGRDSCSVAGKIWGPAHPTPWRPCTFETRTTSFFIKFFKLNLFSTRYKPKSIIAYTSKQGPGNLHKRNGGRSAEKTETASTPLPRIRD
jgi:hypothetical protein